jgi:hypothetical protein
MGECVEAREGGTTYSTASRPIDLNLDHLALNDLGLFLDADADRPARVVTMKVSN